VHKNHTFDADLVKVTLSSIANSNYKKLLRIKSLKSGFFQHVNFISCSFGYNSSGRYFVSDVNLHIRNQRKMGDFLKIDIVTYLKKRKFTSHINPTGSFQNV
jgi:hypothetical protein